MASFDLLSVGIPWFARNLAAELDRFDPQTGRFMTGSGWAVTNQDLMLSLAYLYLTPHAGNPFHNDPALLRTIGLAGDAVRDFQYPDGRVEFVKVDGSRWGPIYMPWTMYHWLETFHLLRAALDTERAARWETGLRLAFAGIERELQERLAGPEPVHNIAVWNAMSLHRAAAVLETPAWRATADQMVTDAIAAQDPAGYWPEHQGPTPSYNLVYVYALGLYHLQGGAVAVRPALERALQFHELFTYPDGTLVETIDGRVKYHDRLNPAVAGFALLSRGRRYVEAIVQRALERGERWSAPHFAQLLRYWDTFPAGDVPSVFEQDHVVAELARALVVKEQGWYACLSGFTCPPVESRWGQDRQSFVSVWHRAAGLIVGGGNSKEQPEWSTFDITTSDGRRCFVPAAGTVDPSARTLTLDCEGRQLRVQLTALDARTLTLRLTAAGGAGDQLATHLPVRLHPGAPFELDGAHVASEEPLSLAAEAGNHQLRQGHWQIAWSGGYTLTWPSFPFNPYAKDGRSDASRPDGKLDLGSAVAILTLPLVPGEPRDVHIALV